MNKRKDKHNYQKYHCGCCSWIKTDKYREKKFYEQPRLLKRVKKLEQAVEEIWGNCECVRKRTEINIKGTASICRGCRHTRGLCICEPENLGKDDTIYCYEPYEDDLEH